MILRAVGGFAIWIEGEEGEGGSHMTERLEIRQECE